MTLGRQERGQKDGTRHSLKKRRLGNELFQASRMIIYNWLLPVPDTETREVDFHLLPQHQGHSLDRRGNNQDSESCHVPE